MATWTRRVEGNQPAISFQNAHPAVGWANSRSKALRYPSLHPVALSRLRKSGDTEAWKNEDCIIIGPTYILAFLDGPEVEARTPAMMAELPLIWIVGRVANADIWMACLRVDLSQAEDSTLGVSRR